METMLAHLYGTPRDLEIHMKFYAAPAVALASLFCVAGTQAQLALSYTLTYNAADGSLTVDTLGGPLYTYSVKTTGTLGGNDGFIEANHILLPNAPGAFSPTNTSTDDELSQSDFDGWQSLSPFSIGNVLPAGLDQTQFNAILDSSIQNTFYVDAPGTLNNPETFKSFEIVYNVPEPSSIVLLGLGAALLSQRRRRVR